MCLAIPSKVVSIDEKDNMATLDTLGVQRKASLDLMQEEVSIGDYVLLHIGYVMGKIDKEDAMQSLELYRQIINEMESSQEDYS